MRRNRMVVGSHLLALSLLGIWGMVEIGSAGTLTFAFWFAWGLHAILVLAMYGGSKSGAWLALVPPALWAGFSGADIVPQVLDAVAAGQATRWDLGSPALTGALLVTAPCAAAVLVTLWQVLRAGKAS